MVAPWDVSYIPLALVLTPKTETTHGCAEGRFTMKTSFKELRLYRGLIATAGAPEHPQNDNSSNNDRRWVGGGNLEGGGICEGELHFYIVFSVEGGDKVVFPGNSSFVGAILVCKK